MKIYMVITYLPKMRIIKLTLAIGFVPLNKLQQDDFDYKCIINDKKKGDTGKIIQTEGLYSMGFGCTILETKESFKNPLCIIDSINQIFSNEL